MRSDHEKHKRKWIFSVAGGLALAFAWPTLHATETTTAIAAPVDADLDGHASIASGGDDCDDKNANRFPGNAEHCDAGHVDDDCNPRTFGNVDQDGDGYFKAQCCNRTATNVYCGNDPFDDNAAIHPQAIMCTGAEPRMAAADGRFLHATCAAGTVCIEQPNETGICAAQPPGYEAPTKKSFWSPPAALGANKVKLKKGAVPVKPGGTAPSPKKPQ